jgi:phosphate transport system substrate-binding protein
MSTANSADRGIRLIRRRTLAGFTTLLLVASVLVLLAGPMPAGADPTLESSGSSFAALAIQQWVGQASTLYGLNINFQVSSSVLGLNAFGLSQDDFAASDIPYSSQQATNIPTQPYEYMPDVAGGLSFMYNLSGNDGQQITNLILDAHVADEIFLGEIVYWDNPDIAALNPQLAGDLPHIPIVPVYRTDASGENYLLTDYMQHQDTTNFDTAVSAFGGFQEPSATWPIAESTIPLQPPFTTTYPGYGGSKSFGQGESGSSNAANYVASSTNDGAITYVETAYAKQHNFPVASLMNASGNAVQPTSVNVAIALEKAVLNADLTQNLTAVYTNPLSDAYPLSAYSYLVTPCSPSLAQSLAQGASSCAANNSAPSPFSSQKGQELGQFVNFLACAGQDSMAALGYSPLPPNLVQEDFWAIGRLNGGVEPPAPSPATCKNPYVDGQTVLQGEPTIIGITVTIGATPPPGSPAAVAAAKAALAAAAAAAAAAKAKASGSGSGAGAGTSSGADRGSAGAGLSAAQIAAGYRLVDGQIVKPSKCEGVGKFLCADQLMSATGKIDGLPLADLLGWIAVVLVLFVLLPLFGLLGLPRIASARRRRSGGLGPDSPDRTASTVQGDGFS